VRRRLRWRLRGRPGLPAARAPHDVPGGTVAAAAAREAPGAGAGREAAGPIAPVAAACTRTVSVVAPRRAATARRSDPLQPLQTLEQPLPWCWKAQCFVAFVAPQRGASVLCCCSCCCMKLRCPGATTVISYSSIPAEPGSCRSHSGGRWAVCCCVWLLLQTTGDACLVMYGSGR